MRYLRLFEEFDPIVQIMVRICDDFEMEMEEVIKSSAMIAYRLEGSEDNKDEIQKLSLEYSELAEDLGYNLKFTRTVKKMPTMPTIFYTVFHKGNMVQAATEWLKEVYGRDMEQRVGVSPGNPFVRKSGFVEWVKDGKQILKVYDPQEAPQCADEAFVNYHQTWAFLDEMLNRPTTFWGPESPIPTSILCDWASYVTGREIKRVSIY
jgi:hypothetical protein